MEDNSHLWYCVFGFHCLRLKTLLLTVLKPVTFMLVNNVIPHCIIMK